MAASLTAHILSDTAVFQDWPHYKSASKYFLLSMLFKLLCFTKFAHQIAAHFFGRFYVF